MLHIPLLRRKNIPKEFFGKTSTHEYATFVWNYNIRIDAVCTAALSRYISRSSFVFRATLACVPSCVVVLLSLLFGMLLSLHVQRICAFYSRCCFWMNREK